MLVDSLGPFHFVWKVSPIWSLLSSKLLSSFPISEGAEIRTYTGKQRRITLLSPMPNVQCVRALSNLMLRL